jgi:hypothetical protein
MSIDIIGRFGFVLPKQIDQPKLDAIYRFSTAAMISKVAGSLWQRLIFDPQYKAAEADTR